MLTGNGRAFCSGADLKAGFDARRRTAGRTSASALRERFHPIIEAHPRRCPSRWSPRSTAPAVGHRAALRARLRPDRRRRVRLLPAGVREHRARARRRLELPDPGADRLRPRGRDGAARRARPGRAGARVGPDQPRRRRQRADSGGRRAGRPPRRRARRAPTPAPSASSTPGSSRAWPNSSSWRPRSSSEMVGHRRTSWRASPRSWRSARASFQGSVTATARRRRPSSIYSRPSCPKDVLRRLLLALAAGARRCPASPPRPRTPGCCSPRPAARRTPTASRRSTSWSSCSRCSSSRASRARCCGRCGATAPARAAPRRRSTATRSSRSAGRSAPP